eukprot:355662-Amphidinium_carterae.1
MQLHMLNAAAQIRIAVGVVLLHHCIELLFELTLLFSSLESGGPHIAKSLVDLLLPTTGQFQAQLLEARSDLLGQLGLDRWQSCPAKHFGSLFAKGGHQVTSEGGATI